MAQLEKANEWTEADLRDNGESWLAVTYLNPHMWQLILNADTVRLYATTGIGLPEQRTWKWHSKVKFVGNQIDFSLIAIQQSVEEINYVKYAKCKPIFFF